MEFETNDEMTKPHSTLNNRIYYPVVKNWRGKLLSCKYKNAHYILARIGVNRRRDDVATENSSCERALIPSSLSVRECR